MIRTVAPKKDNTNYDWTTSLVGQCTWYCYYRCKENGMTFPTWWDRETKTGKWPNAKNWTNEYRDPWVVKDVNYQPVHGDIVVWNGTMGHVAFVEENNGDGTCLVSQYNLDAKEAFSTATWTIGNSLVGKYAKTGNLKGYLHYPVAEPETDYKSKYEAILADMKKVKEIVAKYE